VPHPAISYLQHLQRICDNCCDHRCTRCCHKTFMKSKILCHRDIAVSPPRTNFHTMTLNKLPARSHRCSSRSNGCQHVHAPAAHMTKFSWSDIKAVSSFTGKNAATFIDGEYEDGVLFSPTFQEWLQVRLPNVSKQRGAPTLKLYDFSQASALRIVSHDSISPVGLHCLHSVRLQLYASCQSCRQRICCPARLC
jgi:hypothetical protein